MGSSQSQPNPDAVTSLVNAEIDQQFSCLDQRVVATINRIEVLDYALSHLPPIYQSLQEASHSRHQALLRFREQIRLAVCNGIMSVLQQSEQSPPSLSEINC